jgi:hypothetical protein
MSHPTDVQPPVSARVRETAADRARRMLVGLRVGPSRTTVLTAIGGVTLFIVVLVIGYLTRR